MIELPEVRGRLERDRPLAPLTWLRVDAAWAEAWIAANAPERSGTWWSRE